MYQKDTDRLMCSMLWVGAGCASELRKLFEEITVASFGRKPQKHCRVYSEGLCRVILICIWGTTSGLILSCCGMIAEVVWAKLNGSVWLADCGLFFQVHTAVLLINCFPGVQGREVHNSALHLSKTHVAVVNHLIFMGRTLPGAAIPLNFTVVVMFNMLWWIFSSRCGFFFVYVLMASSNKNWQSKVQI